MNLIYLGKIVNTHGIKGEVRIISDFKFKDAAFKVGNTIYIDNDELIINSYRKHKNYDMITIQGINDINDVLKYKGSEVYIDKDSLKYEGYLDEELIGLSVYDNSQYKGKVVDIYKTINNDLLVIEKEGNKHFVPNISEFVKKVDIENKCIEIKYIKGLDHEN